MKAESVVSPSLLGACEAIVCNAARNCQDLLFREAMLRHNDDSSEWKAAVGQVRCVVGRHRAKGLPRGYQMPCSLDTCCNCKESGRLIFAVGIQHRCPLFCLLWR